MVVLLRHGARHEVQRPLAHANHEHARVQPIPVAPGHPVDVLEVGGRLEDLKRDFLIYDYGVNVEVAGSSLVSDTLIGSVLNVRRTITTLLVPLLVYTTRSKGLS